MKHCTISEILIRSTNPDWCMQCTANEAMSEMQELGYANTDLDWIDYALDMTFDCTLPSYIYKTIKAANKFNMTFDFKNESVTIIARR